MPREVDLVERTRLRGVVTCGQTSGRDGIEVELLAIEIREGGGLGHLRVRGDRRADPAGQTPVNPARELRVADDRGTRYRVAPRGGAGDEHSFLTAFAFVPAPPAEATTVTIEVARLRGVGVAGPWQFQSRLASASGASGLWIAPLRGPDAVAFHQAQLRALELRDLVARSPLVRVVPVGQVVARSGVAVELSALEIRQAGASARLRFTPSAGDGSDQARPGHPEVEVRDEAGTTYEVGMDLRSRMGMGGECDVIFVPAPPTGSMALTLSVTQFVVPPGPPLPAPQPPFRGPISGPWRFRLSHL